MYLSHLSTSAPAHDVEVVGGIRLERFRDAAEVLRLSSRVASGSRDSGCELALEILVARHGVRSHALAPRDSDSRAARRLRMA